jgi:hypothetical protein
MEPKYSMPEGGYSKADAEHHRGIIKQRLSGYLVDRKIPPIAEKFRNHGRLLRGSATGEQRS